MSKTGGYDCNFVEPVPSSLTCPVCLLPFRDPHLLDCCGAKYCASCIGRVNVSGQPCPICKQPFSSIVEKNDQKRVLGLKVHCSNEGCEWIGELRHLAHHERVDCEWVLVVCCGKSVPRVQLGKHECPEQLQSFMRNVEEQYKKEVVSILNEERQNEFSTLVSVFETRIKSIEDQSLQKLRVDLHKMHRDHVIQVERLITDASSKNMSKLEEMLEEEREKRRRIKRKTFSLHKAIKSLNQHLMKDLYYTLPILAGIALSIILGLLVYGLSSLLDRFNRIYSPNVDADCVIKHPNTLSHLFIWSLYISHQVFHWSMLYYAQNYLKQSSRKIHPFHYWMAGMNLVFVLLHLIQTHVTYDGLVCSHLIHDHSLLWILWFILALSIHIVESDRRGFFLCYSFFHSPKLVKFAKKTLWLLFSAVILFNFWNYPLDVNHNSGLVVQVLELFFIAYSCLARTSFHENKYWLLWLEISAMQFGYPVILRWVPIQKLVPVLSISIITALTCLLTIVISKLHELSFRKPFKMLIEFVLLAGLCFVCDEMVFISILYFTNVLFCTLLSIVFSLICLILKLMYPFLGLLMRLYR